jgi:hypothetical protein
MHRLKALLLLALLPTYGFATESHYCIAADGGFGHGGTTYVAPNFSIPAVGTCSSWQGFSKTASTVIVFTHGMGCLSSNGKVLTFGMTSYNPNWIPSNSPGSDYIVLERSEDSGPFTSGSDTGDLVFGISTAKFITCTSTLLELPSSHD